MLNRITVAFVLAFAIPFTAAAQQGGFPAGAYQQQQQYPQQQQQGFPQQPQQQGFPQQQYPQQQLDPYGQPYPQQPGYGPAPQGLGAAGMPGMYGEPMVSSVKGRLQLSLGTYFVRFTSMSQSFADNPTGDLSVSDLKWGFSGSSPVILEGGYGITDNIVIGGVLQLGGLSNTVEADMGGAKIETSGLDLLIAPKFDYQFSPTAKVNPFVGGMLGIEVNSASAPGGVGGTTDDSQLNFTLLARGGLRCFLFDGLSIDPAIVFGFRIGSGTTKLGGAAADLDYSLSGFRLGLSVSMSGWLGV